MTLPGAVGTSLSNTVFASWGMCSGLPTLLLQVDKLIQTVAIGMGLSQSGWVWNNMHNKHHATPNKVQQCLKTISQLQPLQCWAAHYTLLSGHLTLCPQGCWHNPCQSMIVLCILLRCRGTCHSQGSLHELCSKQ